MKTRTIIEYILAAIIVLILGGLAGWYFFLRTQSETTVAQTIARGFGVAIPEGDPNGSISSASSNTPEGTQTGESGQRPAQLWHVEPKPVAGHVFIENGENLQLRYVERASGYVLEANPETGQVVRLTNTLMPKIYEAFLSENGHVIERSVDVQGNITTFAGSISTSTANASSSMNTLTGHYLDKNIVAMSMEPRFGTLLYIARGQNGGSAVIKTNWDGTQEKTLLESVITSWRPVALEGGRFIITQAAADSVLGYSYEINEETQNPLLGSIPGLVVRVRPTLATGETDALLWSQSNRGELSLFVRTGQNATAIQIPIRTLADKCAWSPEEELIAYCGVPQGSTGQNFIDNWYRGVAHPSDALWRIDASAGVAEMLYAPPSNTPIDVENMIIDKAGEYMSFMNASDKSLWIFRFAK